MIETRTVRAGRLDYVFNNAGTGVMGETHLLEKRDWDLTIDINVRGVVNVIRSAYPRLVAQGYGHLVNTASMAGLIGSPFLSVYVGYEALRRRRVEVDAHRGSTSTACASRRSAPAPCRTPLLTGGSIGRSIYEMSDARKLSWWERFRPGDVDVFAKETLDAVAKNEADHRAAEAQSHRRARSSAWSPGSRRRSSRRSTRRPLADFPEMRAPKERPAPAATVPLDRSARNEV